MTESSDDPFPASSRSAAPPTSDRAYSERLSAASSVRWKHLLNVQAPYQAHVRRLHLGRTIDVGCGLGRNLVSLPVGSVGVDHNRYSIEIARSRGLVAHTDAEFFADAALTAPASYDSLLVAHLVEHLEPANARSILSRYVALLRPGGRVVFITPQERGFASDETHVTFTAFDDLVVLAHDLGLAVARFYSFPLPRWSGRVFAYNEFVVLARKPGRVHLP